MKVDIDSVDKIILRALQENARISLTELARMTHLTRNAIKHRIRLMEDGGLIRGYTAIVDPLKLEDSSLLLFRFEAETPNIPALVAGLRGCEEVFEFYRSSGTTPVHAVAAFRTPRHQDSFITETVERLPIRSYDVDRIVQIVERKGIPIL